MKRYIKSNYGKDGYMYITKHGIGPGTLPKDVKLLDVQDLDNYMTAIWLDRFLTTKELEYYDIYPETSWQHKEYSKAIKSSKINGSYQHTVYDDVNPWENENTMYICDDCLQAIKSHGDRPRIVDDIYVDENDPDDSYCEFCDEWGYDHLNLINFK